VLKSIDRQLDRFVQFKSSRVSSYLVRDFAGLLKGSVELSNSVPTNISGTTAGRCS